ncbi:MAG: hypothetical protein IJF78_08335, partial [Clostridia bacterium]|nr:hypothetical protein [Clostridia bacterium]
YICDIVLLFSFSEEKRSKKGTFSCVLSVSTSAEVDEGLCPLNPCELLKKLEQNFYTCDSPFFMLSGGDSVSR